VLVRQQWGVDVPEHFPPLDRVGELRVDVVGEGGQRDVDVASATAALKAARSGDAASQKGQECEAGFYLGAKAVIEGNPAIARDLLTTAAATCPRYFIEVPAIRFELARLPQ